MHAVEELLLKAKAKLDAANVPGGPVVRFFQNQPPSEGEIAGAGIIIITLGTLDPSDTVVSLSEEQHIIMIEFGLTAPVPDTDPTGYGPMLALDEFVVTALFDDTNLDQLAADMWPGTLEPVDEENPDIGEIVRRVPVAYNAPRNNPAQNLAS